MKIKTSLFLICFFGIWSSVSAQSFAVDKKASIISGSVSFTSQGGEIFEDLDGNKVTSFTFTPNFNHFITKNFFIGGSLELSTESQGDYSSNGFGIGPQIGYAFGGPQSKAYPYLDLGILYYKVNADYGGGDSMQLSGSDILLGFGVIVPIKAHIGLIFEGGYQMLNLNDKDTDSSYSGNIFSIAVGIAGLIFQNPN
jgi:hypothetical protein